jgi:DNA-binding MarR family transcriptional regulator
MKENLMYKWDPVFPVSLSTIRALNGKYFFALVHAYLKTKAKDDIVKVSNREASELFGVTPRYITASITALRKAGLIEYYQYDGRNRVIKLTK